MYYKRIEKKRQELKKNDKKYTIDYVSHEAKVSVSLYNKFITGEVDIATSKYFRLCRVVMIKCIYLD